MSKKIEIILKRYKRDKTPFILNLLFISISIVTLYLSINNSYYFFFISVPSSIFSLWSISILFENAKHDYEDYLEKEKEKTEWESKSTDERDRIIKHRVKSAKEDFSDRMEGDRKWREYNEEKKNSKISDDRFLNAVGDKELINDLSSKLKEVDLPHAYNMLRFSAVYDGHVFLGSEYPFNIPLLFHDDADDLYNIVIRTKNINEGKKIIDLLKQKTTDLSGYKFEKLSNTPSNIHYAFQYRTMFTIFYLENDDFKQSVVRINMLHNIEKI